MNRINVTIDGKLRQLPRETQLLALAEEYRSKYPADIVLALVDGKLQELRRTLKQDCTVNFVTTAQTAGMSAYERSALMLMNKAICDLFPGPGGAGVIAEFAVSDGIYIESNGAFTNEEETLEKIRSRMQELVEQNIPIEKYTKRVEDAIAFFRRTGMKYKEQLFRFRRSSFVNLYRIDGFSDYYYGYMVPSTGYLRVFDIRPYKEGFVLVLPGKADPGELRKLRPQDHMYSVMKDDIDWGKRMGYSTVGEINEQIASGHMEDMILIAEARQEARISAIADQIVARPDVKMVMIAGPSSSGKTSFSHRLSIQLKARGYRPHPLAVDDYFVDREHTPRDENGEYDFEALECVDVAGFNKDMNALLSGEEVALPTFDFVQGKRVYKGNTLQIGASDILVIEGIHCLNDKLTAELPPESRFRIYISALTQLNIDEHNRIPTTDGRLIRRMIRDARTRGTSARETISRWPSVRKGEEKNIFPYQESADAMFNSSMVYEFSVMKPFAEQLLYGIPADAPEFLEAKRLLKFFDYFLTINSDAIPRNSLLKEFIGGSIFRV